VKIASNAFVAIERALRLEERGAVERFRVLAAAAHVARRRRRAQRAEPDHEREPHPSPAPETRHGKTS
jgi:hypothetical protein